MNTPKVLITWEMHLSVVLLPQHLLLQPELQWTLLAGIAQVVLTPLHAKEQEDVTGWVLVVEEKVSQTVMLLRSGAYNTCLLINVMRAQFEHEVVG